MSVGPDSTRTARFHIFYTYHTCTSVRTYPCPNVSCGACALLREARVFPGGLCMFCPAGSLLHNIYSSEFAHLGSLFSPLCPVQIFFKMNTLQDQFFASSAYFWLSVATLTYIKCPFTYMFYIFGSAPEHLRAFVIKVRL